MTLKALFLGGPCSLEGLFTPRKAGLTLGKLTGAGSLPLSDCVNFPCCVIEQCQQEQHRNLIGTCRLAQKETCPTALEQAPLQCTSQIIHK